MKRSLSILLLLALPCVFGCPGEEGGHEAEEAAGGAASETAGTIEDAAGEAADVIEGAAEEAGEAVEEAGDDAAEAIDDATGGGG